MARQILDERKKSRLAAEKEQAKKRKEQEKAKQGMSNKTVQGGFSCGLCLCLFGCLWVCSQHCPANVRLCV
jgi:hypothetical protein